MGPPWALGLGTLGIALIALFFLFSGTPLMLVPGVLLIGIAVAAALGARKADSGGTAPDPVTGGRRWWQKRWDE